MSTVSEKKAQNVKILSCDIENYLDDHDKSELSRIIWKIEQLKGIETDPNQLQAEFEGDHLVLPEGEGD